MSASFLEETQLRVFRSTVLGTFLISGASKKGDECPLEPPDFSLPPVLEIHSRGKLTPALLLASGL